MTTLYTNSSTSSPRLRIGEEEITQNDIRKLHYIIGLVDYMMNADPRFRRYVTAYHTAHRLNGEDTNELR